MGNILNKKNKYNYKTNNIKWNSLSDELMSYDFDNLDNNIDKSLNRLELIDINLDKINDIDNIVNDNSIINNKNFKLNDKIKIINNKTIILNDKLEICYNQIEAIILQKKRGILNIPL